MKISLFFYLFVLLTLPLLAEENMQETPQYLYKVLSMENWMQSQSKSTLVLSKDDAAFIHFSTEDQLERILDKYWANILEYVILKIDPKKLPGRLIFEANPSGINKYYHLYDGYIPLKAVVATKIIR